MFKTQYPKVELLINQFSELLQQTLGSKLKGIYLFGSLVADGFDPKVSDIDLLAIVESVITDSELKQLKEVHANFIRINPEWDNRIEVAYVSVEGMKYFKITPNKIARISPGEPLHYRNMDIEWLMDCHMVQEQGKTIFGPPPQTYIPSITKQEYVQSVRTIMYEHKTESMQARHKGYQSYVVMSCCRNLYAIKHGKQISKIAGARWAAKQYPEWANFINEATTWRGMADKSGSPETQKAAIKFALFAIEEAKKL